MLRSLPWQEVVAQAGLQISQATTYRLLQRARTEGESVLRDGSFGHPSRSVLLPDGGWKLLSCQTGLTPPGSPEGMLHALRCLIGAWHPAYPQSVEDNQDIDPLLQHGSSRRGNEA